VAIALNHLVIFCICDFIHINVNSFTCVFTCIVHGNWANWTSYSECSSTCGSGVYIRTRTCSDPYPAFGGETCFGKGIETIPCENLPECLGDEMSTLVAYIILFKLCP
jgi:hypothetical protein